MVAKLDVVSILASLVAPVEVVSFAFVASPAVDAGSAGSTVG